MGIRPNQATSEDYHRVHSPVDGTIVSIRGYEKDELFPGAVLRHRNGDVESYSHRQNYRKKQNGKMPGYYPGNPQMIFKKM